MFCKRFIGKSQIKRQFLAGLVAACVCSLGITDLAEAAPSTSRTLEASFKNPPDSARIWVYWFWLNGNITRGGITADLEAMKRAGVGGVLIMEVDQGTPVGPVAFMSDRWRELFKHMVAEAHRLGIEVNMNNDVGWNGSGGPWVPPNHPPDNPIKDACIKVVNFKSDWKVFVIYREGAQIGTWGHFEQSKHTPDPFAGPWNHWPVGLNPSDGRYAVSHDRVTHASIGDARHVGNFIMYGFTDKSATSLIPLAKAWNHPPTLTNLEGCESRGYRQTERAYILASKASSMSFTLNGSEETPVYNPCFAIENWTSENKSRLVVNGIEMESGKSFRQGITRDADGTMTLVVWVELESVSPVRFAVEDGEG